MKGPINALRGGGDSDAAHRVADLEKKLSRSFAAGSLSNSNAPSSPRTMDWFRRPDQQDHLFFQLP